jgi:hypothetical protein
LAVNEITEEGQTFALNFEVSIVGYRDFEDETHFETHDFTSEIPEIETFLGTLRAKGGGDQPEDVKGAFIHALFGVSEKAKKLSWKNDTASKTIYLITDAPAHGAFFHDSGAGGDHYFRDNHSEWDALLKELKDQQISFSIIKINNNTTKMCDKFRDMCSIAEVLYNEIDISQQITHAVHHPSDELECACSGMPMEHSALPTLSGKVESYMTSMYRMTSAGYATSRATSHASTDHV